MPTPKNPRAWAQAKITALKERDKWEGQLKESMENWDARLAQRATQIYADRGHEWEGEQKGSSLSNWTREKWQYALGDRKGRYLPQALLDSLPERVLREENKRKKDCTTRGEKRCPYGPRLLKAYRDWRAHQPRK